jgi:hypothetical protein
MRFEFRTTEGQICCRADSVENLCPRCTAALRASQSRPNPYASVMRTAAVNLGPDYQPYGTPPDPYALALAKRTPKEAA